MARRTRRTRSPHPGVVLIAPDAEHATWRARFVDPDTGRMTKVRLDPLALRTAEARRDWSIRKAQAIARRKMELESGAPRTTGTPLAAAVERYYDAHTRLRKKTLDAYRASTAKFLAWAEKAGVRSADELTRARLLDFRERIVNEPKRVAAAAGRRGERRATTEPRSVYSVNRDLRGVRTVLGYLAELDLLPKIREGDLRRALRKLPVATEAATFLRPTEIARLLDAALMHDAETFTETRNEHAGRRPPGTTPRYDAIAPFLATLLLSGMRLGEGVTLEWGQVDLDALGDDGQPVGEIRLDARTKTKRARTIDLSVSPALRRLLMTIYERDGKPSSGRVFAISYDGVAAAVKRLRGTYGAPSFSPQILRSTCGTFLTCAPGIFGAASAYRSARQLGHSVQVAERHYLGLIRGIPREARTLETAMQIEVQMARVIEAAARRAGRGVVST